MELGTEHLAMNEPTCINIVADGEKYSAMADALATSIYVHHSKRKDLRIVIGIPDDNHYGLALRKRPWSAIADFVLLPAPSIPDSRTSKPYRHFNKIVLLELSSHRWRRANQLLLDSDLVLLRHLPLSYLEHHAIAAMPVHYYGWRGSWAKLYRDTEVTPDYLTISSSGAQVGPPYFNAGVVWLHREHAHKLSWASVATRIYESNSDIPEMNIFPWLDQLSLPLAAALIGQRIYELPDCMNTLHDKLVLMAEVARIHPDSSYTPRAPFLVHHHGQVTRLPEIIRQFSPSLADNAQFSEALKRLIELEAMGLIRQNRVRSSGMQG